MPCKDIFASNLDTIPARDRWAWRRYGQAIYNALRKRYSKNDVFTRVDLRDAEGLDDLTASARRAAVSVTFRHLVERGLLVQLSKTRFALPGTKVTDNVPKFLTGRYADIWMNHGHTFEQAIRALPKNKIFDRSSILTQIEWLPEKSVGTRYVYFSMIEAEVIGRGILKSVADTMYKR